MLIRALIVLLLALNLGAAAWWMTRPAPAPAAPPVQPAGVPRLQLMSEAVAVASPAPAPAAAAAAAAGSGAEAGSGSDASLLAPADPAQAVAAATPQCYSLGSFADTGAANAAAASIGAVATRTRVRELPGRAASGYQVTLPPQADRAAAQALAQRIGAAGFEDYLVINAGDAINGIALGRYATLLSAERRQAALQVAGFPAQLQPLGDAVASQWWLDLAAAPGAAEAQLRQAGAAAQSRSLDCAALR